MSSAARKRDSMERPPPATLVHRPSPHVQERDFTDAAYKPHTIGAGLALFLLFYVWNVLAPVDEEPRATFRRGFLAAAWAFISYGVIHLPDGIMLRPHPALWRGVQAVGVLYLAFTIFMTFQTLDTTQLIFAAYDPQLAVPLPEQSYAEDCRFSTESDPHQFWHTVADVFLVAHLLGYWAKTLILRDWRVVTAVSIGFEIIEVTFQHVLPNFAECWWDHVIVDVLLCNAGGTLLGVLTLRAVNAKQFHWVRLQDIKSAKGKARRVLTQFVPRDGLLRYRWNMFENPKRFFEVLLVLSVVFIQEVNCFVLKFILNMAPSYHLVVGRLAMWGLIATPGIRELYDYISEPTVKRMGTMVWIGAASLFFETVWAMKLTYQGGYFKEPTPDTVWIPWLIVLVCGSLWTSLYFGFRTARTKPPLRLVLGLLFYTMPIALAVMFLMTNKDIVWRPSWWKWW